MPLRNLIGPLQAMLAGGKCEPFIRHIRFPRYKNLASGLTIEFDFPITALVGPNGTNKSSILVAIQGAPGNRSPGQYWFSTDIDPIEETGDVPNSLIYGYMQPTKNEVVEVIKLRIADAKDPDLWETSRPIRRFGMEAYKHSHDNKNKTRWDPIDKTVIYLDFRQSLSAFDKIFYHSEPRQGPSYIQRKALIRHRSVHLLKAIVQKSASFLFARIERIREKTNRELGAPEVAAISQILGREYKSIHWIRYYPGGSKTLWAHFMPTFAAEQRSDVLVLLDGDERPATALINPDFIGPAEEHKLTESLKAVSGVDINFNVDGGSEGKDVSQENAARRAFMKWVLNNVDYLPSGMVPEEFVWKSMKADAKSDSLLGQPDFKKRFDLLTRLELGINASEDITSRDILQTQQRRVADLDVTLPELAELLSILEKFAAK
jgi:AAA domain